MTTKNNRRALAQAEEDVCFYYSPDVLPQMQSLLAALADIDCTFESDLDIVRNSDTPEPLKQDVMRTLQQRHQERRAPLVQQLEALYSRALVAR
jgi:hypothetical protein